MSKTILTIDDSPSIRQMVAMTLSGAGYRVLEAANGLEGYNQATGNAVNAVVVDLNMPVMNGLDFLRKFRAHPSGKGVPVVLLTTESDETLKKQAREAGATGWIMKPFNPAQLLSVIAKVAGA